MIDQHIKERLLKIILERGDYLGNYSAYDGLLTFLNKIWSLRSMPSTDDRFINAYDDIYQHMINNSDWEDTYLYEDILNLINGEEAFFNVFLETVVNPETRRSKDEIIFYVSLINNELSSAKVRLVLVDYFEGLPLYKIRDREIFSDLPVDIVLNIIPFYKLEVKSKTFPCFIISSNNWDDYNHKTTLEIDYHKKQDEFKRIGVIKIMKREIRKTWNELPEQFTNLTNEFCSLWQKIEYYHELKKILPNNYQSVLLALRDVMMFPKILEEFETDNIFRTSLIRGNDVEKLARTGRFEMQGSITDYFTFSYYYRPPYAEDSVALKFDFDYQSSLQHRIYAIIGKNGTGKTSILSTLAKQLSLQDPELISPRKPLYSKYFTVSYSFFDRFDIPEQNASFNYIYCGLKKRDGTILSEQEQLEVFFLSVNKIKERELLDDWYAVISNFIPVTYLDLMFKRDYETEPFSILSFSEVEFRKIRERLSSGESILFYILTRIISEIREDSLILYDEPETHLHPNAISSLMSTLFDVVKRFRSFCILATHSPLVIREIHARDVFILKRDEQVLEVKRMERDSFGENLTVITEEIFGNRDVNKHHLELIKQFVKEKKTTEEIEKMFEYEGLPINLNTRLYIKSLITDQNEES